MAITNHERVGRAMDLLREGLRPFVERELKARLRGITPTEHIRQIVSDSRLGDGRGDPLGDVAVLLLVIDRTWEQVFKVTLGRAERSLVHELRDWRNKWAHQEPFSSDDTERALDSTARLLTAISATQADEVNRNKQELRRLVFDEQVRGERRRAGKSLIEPAAASGLKPWREVITPHRDVATGRYQHAEFAADLWQVHLGEGTDEYLKPAEFFRRTFLTGSLRRLLVGAVRRLSGGGGDPVVQLQTNFGGGKTHSMLALYHLFSGTPIADMAGVDGVLAEAGVKTLPNAKRVVLVGNKISPGNPVTKPDGPVVRTLWGELAYQLGGKKAFARIAADDEKATSPGDKLRELFNEYAPCLVLVDEWVAYARQLHDEGDLPAGSFETQFSFAQVLTESARASKNCLLVVSLPASDTPAVSPHIQADDLEVGGIRGREALDRLRNVVGRMESSWRPATAEEGFEIVRRRLFEPLAGAESFKQRDVTARAFSELYNAQSAEFPLECRSANYEKRIQAAYPIHPEIFDRLYGDWSTLVKFQRTRGVLRLMASVINALWEKGDKSPLIMPSTIPIDDPRVQWELTRYLSDNWVPIMERDVDGPGSTPVKIDGELPNLGRIHATRRVARTIYLGSAPTTAAAQRGLEDRRVKLGCVIPGESPAVFGDALRRLASSATYLYQDGPRFWYSTQPTVTKLAEDRAEQYKRDPDKVAQALDRRIRADLQRKGDFARVHPLPRSGADVPDDLEAGLVVLLAETSYAREPGSPAEVAATEILEKRGNSPRIYQNTLVFLAADRARMQDLDAAIRRLMAWESVLEDKNTLNLDPHQVRQAETQKKAAEGTVLGQIPETYQWLLVPVQSTPQSSRQWQPIRVAGGDPLAVRAGKRLRNDELLITALGPTILRKHMDDQKLWRDQNHVELRQLIDDFGRYHYLPRLADPSVLVAAAREGVALLTWATETFAFADSFNLATGEYRGLRGGQQLSITQDSTGLLVKPDVARRQLEADAPRPPPGGPGPTPPPPTNGGPPEPPAPTAPRRYHGTVSLDAARVGRDAGRIAEEVIGHLAGLVGAQVSVTLEIQAEVPDGVPENVVRIVTENGRTLKFTSQGFEKE